MRDGLNLAQAGEPSQRFDLDLADALPRQAKPAADLLQRLRLVVVEAVAEHKHLPLALAERSERLLERLAAEGELDLLLGKGTVAGDEVAEDGVLLVADGLIEARHRTRRGTHLACLPIEQARQLRAAARAAMSLDQPVGDQEDAVLGDFVAGEGLLPEEQVELSLGSQALRQALAALSERERQVLVLRYGLDDDEPKTLEEIGCRLDLTRERIRQIQVEALRRLASLREIQAVPH